TIVDGQEGDPSRIDRDRKVEVRETRHEPARALTVAEARDSIVAEIRADRARARVEAEADAMLEQIAGGQALQALADARSLQLQDIKGMPRGAPVPAAQAAEAHVKVPVPDAGQRSAGEDAPGRGRR